MADDKREMINLETPKQIPACEEFVTYERYAQRIPDIEAGADGNDQVQSAKVWEHGRVKKIREVQLGDPTKPLGIAGNGYLGN